MSTYNYIGLCSIKTSMFLAEHSKNQESGFGKLTWIIFFLEVKQLRRALRKRDVPLMIRKRLKRE